MDSLLFSSSLKSSQLTEAIDNVQDTLDELWKQEAYPANRMHHLLEVVENQFIQTVTSRLKSRFSWRLNDITSVLSSFI